MMVYSSDLEEEGMTFTYYNAYKDELYALSESMTFTSDMMVGNGLNAYLFHSKDDEMIPSAYGLENVYPNPFNSSTMISYTLPKDQSVIIRLLDIRGRVLRVNQLGKQKAGIHFFQLDGAALPSGSYIAQVEIEDSSLTQKISLIK